MTTPSGPSVITPGDQEPAPECEVADREPTPDEIRRFEDELVAIIADVIVARRSIAA